MNVINLSYTDERAPEKKEIDYLKGFTMIKFHGPKLPVRRQVLPRPSRSIPLGNLLNPRFGDQDEKPEEE